MGELFADSAKSAPQNTLCCLYSLSLLNKGDNPLGGPASGDLSFGADLMPEQASEYKLVVSLQQIPVAIMLCDMTCSGK